MKTYSQSKQDLFALAVTGHRSGFFIDVGCSIPSFQSNTKLLLENGWMGICLDVQARHEEWKEFPEALFLQTDATKFDWKGMLDREAVPKIVDYASFDVDVLTYDALHQALMAGLQFRCATVEHDAYRFGPDMRERQRQLMASHEYVRIRSDVRSNGCEYEDWYIHQFTQVSPETVKEIESWE